MTTQHFLTIAGCVLIIGALVRHGVAFRRPVPSTQPRQIRIGGIVEIVGTLLVGLAFVLQLHGWVAWVSAVSGALLAVISIVLVLWGMASQ